MTVDIRDPTGQMLYFLWYAVDIYFLLFVSRDGFHFVPLRLS